jgi:uncharacterized delta-60 repeat protein
MTRFVMLGCFSGLSLIVAACSSNGDGASSADSAVVSGGAQRDLVDPSFGTGGAVAGSDEAVPGFSFSPSGRIVVQHTFTNDAITITSLLPDGKPDPDFGEKGTRAFMLAETSSNKEAINAKVLVDDDGTVLVYGSRTDKTDFLPRAFMLRLKRGQLDPTFGTGGIRSLPDPHGFVNSVVPIRNAAGASVGYYAALRFDRTTDEGALENRADIVRLGVDGSVDSSFGQNGVVSLRFPFAEPVELLRDTEGRLSVFREVECEIHRFTRDGAVDGTFGNAGHAFNTPVGFARCEVTALSDGSFVRTSIATSTETFRRLSARGIYDDPFREEQSADGVGVRIVNASADGKLLALRKTGTVTQIERWLPDGNPDPAFSADAFTFGRGQLAPREVHLNQDGTMLVGSFDFDDPTSAFAWKVERYVAARPRP